MNTMATLPKALALVLMLFTSLPVYGGMEMDDSAPDYDAKELEQRLTEARQQLDAAARKLAELNRVKYSKVGAKGKKAMLGIVIDDYGQKRLEIIALGFTLYAPDFIVELAAQP